MRIKNVLFYTLIALTLNSCSKEPEEIVKETPTQTVTIVHNSDVTPIVNWIPAEYEKYKPMPNKKIIKIEGIKKPDLVAMEEISSGKIKNDFWLVSSPAYVEYNNNNVKKLGSKQEDCTPLFSTPIVLATSQNVLKSINTNGDDTINFHEIFENNFNNETKISIFHTKPNLSSSGLAAFVELSHIASNDENGKLDMNITNSPVFINQLKDIESLVALYNSSESKIFPHVIQSDLKKPLIAIVPEQAVVKFNSKRKTPQIKALYPTEGSYWMEYSICKSESKWRLSDNDKVFDMLVKYLLSERAQKVILENGFRPTKFQTLEAPISEEFGVNPSQPQKLLSVKKGEQLKNIYKVWRMVKKPANNIFIIDTSGSMQGETINTVKSFLSRYIKGLDADDINTLITYNDRINVRIKFSKDKDSILKELDKIIPNGGSTVNDAIMHAIQLFAVPQDIQYQKNLFLITDSSDSGSKIDPLSIHTAIDNSYMNQPFAFSIFAIQRNDLNPAPLHKFVKQTNGKLIFSTQDNLTEKLKQFFPLYN